MNVTFTTTLFGWRIGTFTIRLDIDERTMAAASPSVDGAVKRISRNWARRMTS